MNQAHLWEITSVHDEAAPAKAARAAALLEVLTPFWVVLAVWLFVSRFEHAYDIVIFVFHEIRAARTLRYQLWLNPLIKSITGFVENLLKFCIFRKFVDCILSPNRWSWALATCINWRFFFLWLVFARFDKKWVKNSTKPWGLAWSCRNRALTTLNVFLVFMNKSKFFCQFILRSCNLVSGPFNIQIVTRNGFLMFWGFRRLYGSSFKRFKWSFRVIKV